MHEIFDSIDDGDVGETKVQIGVLFVMYFIADGIWILIDEFIAKLLFVLNDICNVKGVLMNLISAPIVTFDNMLFDGVIAILPF